MAVTAARGKCELPGRRGLIEAYLPLVASIARRFAGRGERLEDLVQVGTIGLIGAVDRCDPERSGQLTAYVSRCVEGEIRRHLRDRSSVIRIPRRAQQEGDLAAAAARAPLPLEDDAGSMAPADLLEDVGLARALVASAARSLDGRERRVVALRYYCDLSQAEIGEAVGVSQVHVSRLLHGAIEKMRAGLEPDDARAATVR
jgi:RNA polymerase sigma-B factor